MFNSFTSREGETLPKKPFRSGRYFKLHNYWFFTTREGTSVGPFDSMHCAEKSVNDYIEFIKIASPDVVDFFKIGMHRTGRA